MWRIVNTGTERNGTRTVTCPAINYVLHDEPHPFISIDWVMDMEPRFVLLLTLCLLLKSVTADDPSGSRCPSASGREETCVCQADGGIIDLTPYSNTDGTARYNHAQYGHGHSVVSYSLISWRSSAGILIFLMLRTGTLTPTILVRHIRTHRTKEIVTTSMWVMYGDHCNIRYTKGLLSHQRQLDKPLVIHNLVPMLWFWRCIRIYIMEKIIGSLGGDDGLFILPLFYLDLFLIPRCVNPIRMSSEGALEMNRCG